MADDSKAALAERDARLAEQEAHRKKMRGRPTPTQDEIDLVKLGLHPEIAVDGSEDPFAVKQVEAKPAPGGYATRQVHARETKVEK